MVRIIVEFGSEALAGYTIAIRIIIFSLLLSWGMITIQAFNGAGDTTTPPILNFISFWMVEITVAYTFSIVMGFEETGVFFSIVIAESLLGILGVIMFRRGTWKLRKV